MTSQVDVYNMALGSCGARAKLATTSDLTREAELCNLFYPIARDNIFNAAYWVSLRAVSALTLLAERDDETWTAGKPLKTWQYAYRLPVGYVRPRHLEPHWGAFALEPLGNEITLQTNAADAVLVYTIAREPELWETRLAELVAMYLALKIAVPLTKDSGIYRGIAQQFDSLLADALVKEANSEDNFLPDNIPDWIAARENGIVNLPSTRYSYPVESITVGYGTASQA